MPKISEAADYFFRNILIPNDNLTVITPMKTYRLKEQALQAKSKQAIAEELKGLIRKDCLEGNSEFRSTVSDLTGLAKSLSGAIKSGSSEGAPAKEQDGFVQSEFQGMRIDEQLLMYRTLIDKLDALREINQMKLLDFANHLTK